MHDKPLMNALYNNHQLGAFHLCDNRTFSEKGIGKNNRTIMLLISFIGSVSTLYEAIKIVGSSLD
jgi:hypothetical protein